MSSKEEHTDMLATERARAAKQEYILKGPRANTHSATMPAYAYTILCPDPKRRKPPRAKPERPEGVRPIGSEKICLICRKRWPAGCRRENCDCERQGHLFSTRIYYQRKVRGGAGEEKE